MAHVKLKLYAGLRAYIGGSAQTDVEIEPGETIGRVLEKVSLPQNQARIIFLNHRPADPNYPLNGGEQLGVFPAIGGG